MADAEEIPFRVELIRFVPEVRVVVDEVVRHKDGHPLLDHHASVAVVLHSASRREPVMRTTGSVEMSCVLETKRITTALTKSGIKQMSGKHRPCLSRDRGTNNHGSKQEQLAYLFVMLCQYTIWSIGVLPSISVFFYSEPSYPSNETSRTGSPMLMIH